MDGWHGWQTRKSAHLHASHILPYCSMVALLAILYSGVWMRKHHSKSAQVNGAMCGAWGGHTCTHLSSCPTSDAAMLWDLDFSRSLHTCSKLFWCHAASTVEIRSRGYGPVNLDHPGGPGQPYERSVRVCFSVPGIPVKSWDMSLILGQDFVTGRAQPTTSSGARGLRNHGKPITSSEARGLRDLDQPPTLSEARG